MFNFRKILRESLLSTSRFPRWWILALVQAICLYLIGEFLQPHYWLINPVFLILPIVSVLILSPAIAWLWLDVEAHKLKIVRQLNYKIFFGFCVITSVIIFFSVLLMIVAKLIYPDWLFSALFSSIVSATSTLAILYAVLCGQPFNKALMLAFDTWNKKISIAAIVAFVLLVAHGISFALVHGFLGSFRTMQGFSVLADSATIWVLSLVLMVFVAFAAAFINTFLVLLFLEIIGQKKDPEAEKAQINQLVTSSQTSHYNLDKHF